MSRRKMLQMEEASTQALHETVASHEMLLETVANILTEREVNTAAIERILNHICELFTFDCGFIYEIDLNNQLNLKEFRVSGDVRFKRRFSLDAIDPGLRSYISQKITCYISRDTIRNTQEQEILDTFFAGSAAVTAILDEHRRLNGVILLMNTSTQRKIPDEKLKFLTIALNMLEKCLATRMYQHKLAFAQNSLESILDNTGIDIYVNDFYTHEILYVNRSMAAPYGGREPFMGNKCWEVLFPGQRGPCEFCPQKKLIDAQGNPTKIYSWNYQRPFDGSWFRVFSAAFPWVDGRLAHVVSSADITENKRNEALIHHMANYDELTKLPNRRMLVNECERRINGAMPGDRGYVLFFDIDGFKAINDTFGHDAGDEFLIQLGAFFSSIPMLKDAIYRNGGDEFVAIIDGDVTEANIRSLAKFIHQRFTMPWKLKNGNVFCNTSIGVACYPEDGLTAEVLLNKSDQAMYHIKKTGGGGICFGYELLESP